MGQSGAAFSYRAVSPAGQRVRGIETAASSAALKEALEHRGLLVLDVATSAAAEDTGGGFGLNRRSDVLEVTRAMGALLPAGLPLARALTAAASMASGEVATALAAVRARVERGDSLAAALAEYPRFFSPLYIGLVRAGERSADLAGAFSRLAGQLEREAQLRAKLLSASIYPLLLAVAGGTAIVILLVFVMPRFVELLAGTGTALPASTAALLGLSSAMRRFWPAFLLLALVPVAVLGWIRTSPEGRRAGATLTLRLPVIGTYRRSAIAARFARLMAVLLGGGAPLLVALDDTLESLTDPVARDEIARIRTRVREGMALHAAIAAGTLFPPLLAQLVAVGEESARLQEFLLKAAELLEERTHRALERTVALAEPAMIVTFGGLVGFVALSLLQAIYSLNAGAPR